jgi:hypothetical protein
MLVYRIRASYIHVNFFMCIYRYLLYLCPTKTVLLQLLPPLRELGENIITNFEAWADVRRMELQQSVLPGDAGELMVVGCTVCVPTCCIVQ